MRGMVGIASAALLLLASYGDASAQGGVFQSRPQTRGPSAGASMPRPSGPGGGFQNPGGGRGPGGIQNPGGGRGPGGGGPGPGGGGRTSVGTGAGRTEGTCAGMRGTPTLAPVGIAGTCAGAACGANGATVTGRPGDSSVCVGRGRASIRNTSLDRADCE